MATDEATLRDQIAALQRDLSDMRSALKVQDERADYRARLLDDLLRENFRKVRELRGDLARFQAAMETAARRQRGVVRQNGGH